MDTPHIYVDYLTIGSFQVSTYIIACPDTHAAAVIDPGGEPDRIVRLIEKKEFNPVFILNTHGHRDHVSANADLSRALNIPVYMHEADVDFFNKQTAFQGPEIRENYAVDKRLKDRQVIAMGNTDIQVIHTPGHTPGSVCFYVENCLFSGDTLFVGNAGRTDLPGGNLETLLHSIETRVITLPPETILYPGHDYGITPSSTIAREIKENIYITDFIL